MDATILCLNAGSSSLKFAVFRFSANKEEQIFSGAVEAIGASGGRSWLRAGNKTISEKNGSAANHAEAIQIVFDELQEQGVGTLAGAGHRFVHGGPKFSEPIKIDAKIKAELQTLIPFAPLHLPSELALLDAVSTHYPDLPQVACFDTAFHARMPDVAKRFALPEEFWQKGIRRYGFHGLSYEFIVARLGKALGSRAIVAHLGNGASMVALKDGIPQDTSMGLTPTGGFMMGTRSGDLDPGILLYLLRQGYSSTDLEKMLNNKSGLIGVSGQTSEMKVLLSKQESDPAAALAVEMFCYQIRKFIGAYAAVLGGLDTLVFTGGIGEKAAAVRARICEGLEYLGIKLDLSANECHAEVISSANSLASVRVIETNEDLMIARHTRNLLL